MPSISCFWSRIWFILLSSYQVSLPWFCSVEEPNRDRLPVLNEQFLLTWLARVSVELQTNSLWFSFTLHCNFRQTKARGFYCEAAKGNPNVSRALLARLIFNKTKLDLDIFCVGRNIELLDEEMQATGSYANCHQCKNSRAVIWKIICTKPAWLDVNVLPNLRTNP